MSEWGQWDDEMEALLLTALESSYIRRQQWLARLQAVETVKALAEALGSVRGSPARRPREVGLDAFMVEMGARWQ